MVDREDTNDEEPTFWQNAWSWLKKLGRWTYAPVVAIVIILVVFVLVALGFKNIQLGGILGRLFGKDGKNPTGKKAIDVANSVPEDRVDKDGNLISIGTPDSTGQTHRSRNPSQTRSNPRRVMSSTR